MKDWESRGEKVTSISQADIPLNMCLHVQVMIASSPGNRGVCQNGTFWGRAAASVRVRVGTAELFNTVLGRECESERQPQAG